MGDGRSARCGVACFGREVAPRCRKPRTRVTTLRRGKLCGSNSRSILNTAILQYVMSYVRQTPAPPLQSQAGHAETRRSSARNGGERAKPLSLRSHDANFGLTYLDPLGNGAQAIPPIAAPIHPDPMPCHPGKAAHSGGRHRPIAGAFEDGLSPLGIDLGLIAEPLQADDALLQRRSGRSATPDSIAS